MGFGRHGSFVLPCNICELPLLLPPEVVLAATLVGLNTAYIREFEETRFQCFVRPPRCFPNAVAKVCVNVYEKLLVSSDALEIRLAVREEARPAAHVQKARSPRIPSSRLRSLHQRLITLPHDYLRGNLLPETIRILVVE